MATTYGVDRERVAQSPAVAPDVHRHRRVLLLLGTLTASVTYSAGLSAPPGGLWHADAKGHIRGDPDLHITSPQRYLVFFFCHATAFVASLTASLLLLLRAADLISSNHRTKRYALRVTMALGMLGLIGSSYVAVICLSFMPSIDLKVLAASVIFYIFSQILRFVCVGIPLNSVQETPQKCPKLLRSKKKKYLLKLEQKDRQQQNRVSGEGSGDAYQILKRSRMHLLLLGTLTASATYQAGLNPWGGFWQGKVPGTDQHVPGTPILHDKRYLVFFFCNVSAFVMSLAILPVLILSKVTQGIKHHCVLQVGMILDLLSLIGAYVAGSRWQLPESVSMSKLFGWAPLYVVINIVVFLLQVFLVCVLWRQALMEKMEHCLPGWLKKLFGLSINDDDDDDDDEEEEEEEESVTMEGKLEKRRKLLLLLAILAAILAYHGSASPWPDNLVSYRRLAFLCCNATVFFASLPIIMMLVNRKLPEARCLRWHALRLCVILEVIGLMGAFAAGGYRKISTVDALVLVLAVVLCIAFHLTMFLSGTARGLVQGLVLRLRLGSPQLLIAADPFAEEHNNVSEDELEFGIAGGTNEEPLGLEISSQILGGALTLILAVPVMDILAIPVKLLVGIMIASITVSLWRRSIARLLRALARPLQRRCIVSLQGTTATPHREQLVSAICQGLCKVIHTLCLGTWMWLLILVIWVPSLRHNIKLKFKISKISAVLGVLVVGAPTMAAATTDTPDTATATGTSTTTMTTMDTPTTGRATTTVTGTPTTAGTATLSPSMGRGDEPLAEPRPRRNRRPNSRLIGEDWIN